MRDYINQGQHTMLTKLANYLNTLFNTQGSTGYGSDLEKYIVSKCPTSAAEIDHWARQYDLARNSKGWL
jgi:hypothetical protein